jgi:hypothetical protein
MEQAVAVRKKKPTRIQNSEWCCALLDNGQTVLGSNQENAAYPLVYVLNASLFSGRSYLSQKF